MPPAAARPLPIPQMTFTDYLDMVRKSQLVEPARLEPYLKRLEMLPDRPAELRKVAAMFVRDGLLTNFHADQLLKGKYKGFFVGKYRMLERIGFGGMGYVFLCEHRFMRKRVAMKILPPAKAKDPVALGRFMREARASAAMDHPNVVRVNDIDKDGGMHFLVMEYVDGVSMAELVKKKGPLPVARAANYIGQAAVGMQHAHENGWVHRDIKPGNIMVDRAGVVKVLDMGLAKLSEDEDTLTQQYEDKSVIGTADYIAPEQTEDSHAVDIRADIYSLGATLYFMLTGQPLYPDCSMAQKLLSHQTQPPRPPRELRDDVPAELEAVVLRMLAKAPEDRYQTPAEVVDALTPFCPDGVEPPTEDEMPKLSPAARAEYVAANAGTVPQSTTTGTHELKLFQQAMDGEAGRSSASRVQPACEPDTIRMMADDTVSSPSMPSAAPIPAVPVAAAAVAPRRGGVGAWATLAATVVVASAAGVGLWWATLAR